MFRSKRASGASKYGGPVYDATIDHNLVPPAWFTDYLPIMLAPDPAGLLARRGTHRYDVEYIVPVQRSPQTSWFQGTPYPGPAATVDYSYDQDSPRWWGRTGQGRLVWSDAVELSGDLPPAIPQDMPQHIDFFNRFMGGYPSIGRNRPSAFGDQVPVLFGGGS